uniref:Uncharacterized protein n=1 Tax=Prymnesium polylepis TaxID=72548 RepID=A0A7S4HG25_9EUKA
MVARYSTSEELPSTSRPWELLDDDTGPGSGAAPTAAADDVEASASPRPADFNQAVTRGAADGPSDSTFDEVEVNGHVDMAVDAALALSDLGHSSGAAQCGSSTESAAWDRWEERRRSIRESQTKSMQMFDGVQMGGLEIAELRARSFDDLQALVALKAPRPSSPRGSPMSSPKSKRHSDWSPIAARGRARSRSRMRHERAESSPPGFVQFVGTDSMQRAAHGTGEAGSLAQSDYAFAEHVAEARQRSESWDRPAYMSSPV